MVLPEESAGQRAAALSKAAAARRARADLTARLKRGAINLAEVLDDAQMSLTTGNLRVSELLEAVPGVGKAKARHIMTEIGIAPTRRIRGLTPRQRTALLDRFSQPETL